MKSSRHSCNRVLAFGGVVGSLLLVACSDSQLTDPKNGELLAQLLEWKSRQYREGGLWDVFSFGWTVELLHRILDIQTESFAGMLSVLKFDDKVAAMHMGMRSRSVLHWSSVALIASIERPLSPRNSSRAFATRC